MRHPATTGAFGRVATRTLVLIAAVIAVLVVSTAANLTASVRGAVPLGAVPLKAVIIVGPAHSATSGYLEDGEIIAQEAERRGMDVARVFHPDATWARVKAETTGANLVVYLGHGFGWPSPYPYTLFESQMDGLGLNWPEGDPRRTQNDVHYYGGDRLRESINLAPNSIVILNHLCYSAGFGETGQSAPSLAVARERVDNFAAAFLAVGARTVFALAYQPAESMIKFLFTEHDTMEGIFRMRFNTWTNDSYGGWVGWNPSYHDSVRTDGARILLDPHQSQSYRRAVTGDLEMTTDQWRGSSDPSDNVAPELTSLVGVPSSGTVPAGDGGAPVFTPNGDGLSDTMAIEHRVSENAYLDFVIRDSDDNVVRRFTKWSTAGVGSSNWNGKDDANHWVAEGRYMVAATPRDVAGNVGDSLSTPVKVMKAMRSPAGSPKHFFARDGDGLAAASTLSVTMTRDATLDWTIVDEHDDVVRTLLNGESVSAGLLTRAWDGRDDSGAFVPDGMYRQVLTSTTEFGTYSHELALRVMPYKVTAGRWSGPAGTSVTFTFVAAEPISGWPNIYVYQPGLSRFRASPIKYSAKKFKFTVNFRSGGSAGQVRINIATTDTGGGTQSQNVFFTLE